MVYKPEFNRFFNYQQISELVNKWAEETPDKCKLHVIGKSHQNRDVYALEITNFKVGNPKKKPGFYIEACIHAEEVMGSNVALYIAWQLLNSKDTYINSLLNKQVFYILPRVNPDGAEFVLSKGQPWCGNGRFLPGEEQVKDGFYWHDIDNNGVIAQMRVRDDAGEWKISEKDSRFMVLREPWEKEGEFYRLFPEGLFRNFKGEFEFPKPNDGNLNRQFPSSYYPEGRQYGAGNYALEEPEAKAVAEFILARPNIGGAMSYHTCAGAILRPFGDKSDDHFLGNDLKMYETLGKMGTEITGYPLISVYHGFTPDKNSVRGGCLDDWTFEFLGMPSFVTELWNLNKAAGIEQEGFYLSEVRSSDEEVKVMEYLSQYMDKPFLDWTEFDHPQLGKVEIGGWDRIWTFRNCPPQLLESIAKKHSEYSIKLAATLPSLEIRNVEVKEAKKGLVLITAEVINTGYLPTYLTHQAKFMKKDKSVVVKILSDSDFELVSTDQKQDVGDLAGRSERVAPWSQWGSKWNKSIKRVSWLVDAKKGTQFVIHAENEKAGVATKDITI
ncbi:MAG: M14 family metallopeptidase [Clostridia bacterium]